MATILAPPEPPPEAGDREALIREARARQRRRRILVSGVVALTLGAVVAGYGLDRTVGGNRRAAGGGIPLANLSAFSGHGRLAFVSRGRLYVLDGHAGRLVAVTAGGGASAPAFSPDGRWLTYAYRGWVGVARANGTRPHTLRAPSGAWLPDSDLLAGRGIYRIGADAAPTRIGTAPAGLAAWAADGARYAFVTRRLVHGRDGSFRGTERLALASSLRGPRALWYEAPISFTRRAGFRGPAIAHVVVVPGGVLIWIDPMQSASLAADGMLVYEIRSPHAKPVKLGSTVGDARVSVGSGGRLALPGGVDRIAWVRKAVLTCSVGRCTTVRAPAGSLTLDPAWSPDGTTLALVSAGTESTDDALVQPTLRRWYATRRLWLLSAGSAREAPGTMGAAAPTWSRDNTSLLFVADDSVWLLPRLDKRPVRIAGPLFGSGAWPNDDGQIAWSGRFAWQS